MRWKFLLALWSILLVTGCRTTPSTPSTPDLLTDSSLVPQQTATRTPQDIASPISATELAPGATFAPQTRVPTRTDKPYPTTSATPLPPDREDPWWADTSAWMPLLEGDQRVQLSDLQMLDALNGWALSRQSLGTFHVLRTTDGGRTWTDVSPPVLRLEGPQYSSALGEFWDVDTAWVIYTAHGYGGPSTVWRTQDGGRSWEASWRWLGTVPLSESSGPKMDFIDKQNGWLHIDTFLGAGSYGSDLFRTNDGGQRWTLIMDEFRQPDSSWIVGAISGMDFFDPKYGFVTSSHHAVTGVDVHWTEDGGSSWREVVIPPPAEAPDYLQDQTCRASSAQLFGSDSAMFLLECEYSELGYLYSTQDGGNSWTTQPLPKTFDDFMVQILTPNLIFNLGWWNTYTDEGSNIDTAELYLSQNGGKRWELLGTFIGASQLQFLNSEIGWVIREEGEHSILMQTIDGGRTWEEIQPHTASSDDLPRVGAPPTTINLPTALLPLAIDSASKAQLLAQLPMDRPTGLSFTSIWNALAISLADGSLVTWDITGEENPWFVHQHDDFVYEIEFVKRASPFASASKDGTAWFWWYPGGDHFSLEDHGGEVTSIALSPDGSFLAVGIETGTVRLWDLESYDEDMRPGVVLRDIPAHSNWVWDVAFSPDGRTIASSSADRTIRVWDVETGELLRTLRGHTSTVWRIVFSPSGEILLSASWDGTIKAWDTATGSLLRTLTGHSNPIYALDIHPNGNPIVSGSSDGALIFWDLQTGKNLNKLQGHSGVVRSVVFSPDGLLVASASDSDEVRIWGIEE